MSNSSRQSGLALITVLFALALVTTLAAYVMETQFVNIRRAENLQNNEQAYEYALESEAWAGSILARDKATTAYDHLGESWNKLGVPIKAERGSVKTQVIDLQSRFNLNNLQTFNAKNNRVWFDAFQKLLKTLDLDPDLASAVVDWLDDNDNPTSPKGAEDYDYLGLEPPYRAANWPFTDISELLKVKGFDRKTFDILKPYISALPTPDIPINVNTCDPLLLRILPPGSKLLTKQEANDLAAGRGAEGYRTMDEFRRSTAMSGTNGTLAEQLADIKSRYFQIRSEAKVQRSHLVLMSDVERVAGPSNTILSKVTARRRVLR